MRPEPWSTPAPPASNDSARAPVSAVGTTGVTSGRTRHEGDGDRDPDVHGDQAGRRHPGLAQRLDHGGPPRPHPAAGDQEHEQQRETERHQGESAVLEAQVGAVREEPALRPGDDGSAWVARGTSADRPGDQDRRDREAEPERGGPEGRADACGERGLDRLRRRRGASSSGPAGLAPAPGRGTAGLPARAEQGHVSIVRGTGVPPTDRHAPQCNRIVGS